MIQYDISDKGAMGMTAALNLIRVERSLFNGDDRPLGLNEVQQVTQTTDQNSRTGADGLGLTLLGLFGETGSLLSELKKKQRDQDAYYGYRESVIEELGDVIWYFSNTTLRAGLQLSALADKIPATLSDWSYHGRSSPTAFADLQKPRQELAGPLSGDRVEHHLLSLAGKVGRLLENFTAGRIADNRDVLSADLVEIFRELIAAADGAEVSLEEAALGNIEKTLGRWPKIRDFGALYDETEDDDEQLPRRIVMTFKEKDVAGKKYVLQQCNGLNIGDRLTDNRVPEDDYRFHDVFHLAYAAILGWSPVLRALFKVKRKSKPAKDENEDGARAALIEEGIATWVFNHGARLQDFRNVARLDHALLRAIRDLVKGYEVENRPLWQWEFAILEGFRIFRELRTHRGGVVTADLHDHSIKFESR
ncbi:MAG: pyrophosphatase [Hyphomonadaceae bacterium]